MWEHAAATEFLTDLRGLADPKNLEDGPDGDRLADRGARMENIRKGSMACTELIKVKACAPENSDSVCVEGHKQRFGLAHPVNKYSHGPKHQPDGVWVFADGKCEYAFQQLPTLQS